MGDYLEAAYDGFPKLFHILQGLVWRLTGLPQAVDVLNVGALVLFCLFLRGWFRVLPPGLLRAACCAAHPNSCDFDLH